MNIKSGLNKALNSPTIMSWTSQVTIFAHGLLVTPLIIIMFSKDQVAVWYLLQTLVGLGLLKTKSEARRLIEQGGFYVNQQQMTDISQHCRISDRNSLMIRIGKRAWYQLIWPETS